MAQIGPLLSPIAAMGGSEVSFPSSGGLRTPEKEKKRNATKSHI